MKTRLHCIILDKEQAEKLKRRRKVEHEKRHKRNRIGNDEKLDRKILLEDENDGE